MSAGVIWLLAALTSGVSTLVFREDSVWYPITLVACVLAIGIGILLMVRLSRAVSLASVSLGFLWVGLYMALLVIQFDDIQAWTADLFFAVLGATAAFKSYRELTVRPPLAS